VIDKARLSCLSQLVSPLSLGLSLPCLSAIVSPGGFGFDINCGVRLIRSNLTEANVCAEEREALAKKLFQAIPVTSLSLSLSSLFTLSLHLSLSLSLRKCGRKERRRERPRLERKRDPFLQSLAPNHLCSFTNLPLPLGLSCSGSYLSPSRPLSPRERHPLSLSLSSPVPRL